MILPELSRMISPRWNQVTKQETVVEGYPDVEKNSRSGQSLRSSCQQQRLFHLRILLHVVKGSTSFISLRTFQGITYEIFQGFCKAMYLLEDDT